MSGDAMNPRRLTDLEAYLVDEHFKWAELSRSYGPSGIYGRVQWFLTHDLPEAIAAFERSHDDACELVESGYRNCNCFYRQPVSAEPVSVAPLEEP